MKTFLILGLLLVALPSPGQVATNATEIATTPAGWSYASTPGTYFWTGVKTGTAVVAFCLALSMLRTIGGAREDL